MTRLGHEKENFYATLAGLTSHGGVLVNCTDSQFEYSLVALPAQEDFGEESRDYYTLVTN